MVVNKITLSLLVLTGLMFIPTRGYSQIQDQEVQLWSDVIVGYKFNDKISHVGDAGARYFTDTHWYVFYIRPTLKWNISSIVNVSGGVSLFYSSIPDFANITELRGTQSVAVKWPTISGFYLQQRVMVEQRWFFTNEIKAEFKFRGRYRALVSSPRYSVFSNSKSTYNQLMIEFLDHLDSNDVLPFNNNQRYTVVFGHVFSKKMTLEAHYQLHGLHVKNGDGINIQQHVVRIRFKINLGGT